jgi:pimeloyl-ACP methyl ester carboxylesterase
LAAWPPIASFWGGFSMGAVVAMAAAARRDPRADRVAGIVAVGPYLDFHASLRGRLGRSGYPARPMSDLVLGAFRLAGIRPPGAGRVAPDLRCPLLVLHGSDDVVCPPEHGRAIAAMVPGGRFRELDGAEHSDGHLVAADVLESEIAAFVRSLGPAGSGSARPESPVRP